MQTFFASHIAFPEIQKDLQKSGNGNHTLSHSFPPPPFFPEKLGAWFNGVALLATTLTAVV